MPDELDLRAIRAFVALVDAGDFTAAARALRLTHSAVGKALVRLEQALGVKLLHRTTRRVGTATLDLQRVCLLACVDGPLPASGGEMIF